MPPSTSRKRPRIVPFAVALSFTLVTPVPASDDGQASTAAVVAEIESMEQELARAIVQRDHEALLKLEAETYVHTDSDGHVATRDDFIASYKAGTSDVTALRFDDLVVVVYEGAAVVRGIATVERPVEGVKASRSSRYTRFYVRFPEGWRAVAGHASVLKTEPQPTG